MYLYRVPDINFNFFLTKAHTPSIVLVCATTSQKTENEEGKEGSRKGAAAGSPETEPNYKSICRQLQQKNQQLGKAYQDLKAQFDELEDSCQQHKMAPLGATKFEKVSDQLNKV